MQTRWGRAAVWPPSHQHRPTMPRRAQSDEPQTDNESEQEEQEQPAGGLKNPGRTLQHMMLQVFFSRPVMTNAAVKRVYAKCVKLSTSEHICCLPTGAPGRATDAPARAVANAPALATFMSDLEGPLATCGLSLKNRLDVDTNTLTWILVSRVKPVLGAWPGRAAHLGSRVCSSTTTRTSRPSSRLSTRRRRSRSSASSCVPPPVYRSSGETRWLRQTADHARELLRSRRS